MKYEVIFETGAEILTTKEEAEQLITELELFERDDISMISEIDNNDVLVRTIWTEEEGIINNL